MLQALGLAVVPLSLVIDRRRWLCLLAAHFAGFASADAEGWPFAGRTGDTAGIFRPAVPNAIGAAIPLFSRLERSLTRRWKQRARWWAWLSCRDPGHVGLGGVGLERSSPGSRRTGRRVWRLQLRPPRFVLGWVTWTSGRAEGSAIRDVSPVS